MRKQIVWLGLVILALAGSGCGKITFNYPSQLAPEVKVAPRSPVLVAVQDKRSYVLKKETQESFAGLMRGMFSVPSHIESVTRKPLAEDVAAAVAKSLQKNGATVTPLRMEPMLSEAEVRNELMKKNPGQVLFLEMKELKVEWSFESVNVGIFYDLVLTLYDGRGKLAGTATATGTDIEKSPRGLQNIQDRFTVMVNERLSALLNDPKIAKALK